MPKAKRTTITPARRDDSIFTRVLRLMPALGSTKSTLDLPNESEKSQDPESTGKAETAPQRSAKKKR